MAALKNIAYIILLYAQYYNNNPKEKKIFLLLGKMSRITMQIMPREFNGLFMAKHGSLPTPPWGEGGGEKGVDQDVAKVLSKLIVTLAWRSTDRYAS